MNEIELDVLIFGGGVAGLWLLDELQRRSHRVLLLERRALGAGQTICSQGILHGGLKYSLSGLVDRSSKAVAEMPARWRASLDGRQPPDLRGVRVLSPHCHMWRTDSLVSRAGLLAAQAVVRTPLERVAVEDRPGALAKCPGDVFRVEEQVLDVASLLHSFLAIHADRILQIGDDAPEFAPSANGTVRVGITAEDGAKDVTIHCKTVVLAAGEGNADLRKRAGLDVDAMQVRPLHMVMVRGNLPTLYGHCVDGNKTRATITTNVDRAGRTIWNVGGEVSEKGAELDCAALLDFAREELHRVLPGVDFGGTQWAAYRINRAEGRNLGNRRPEGVVWRREGCYLTAWPTKLVLAPQLACEIADSLPPPSQLNEPKLLSDWPRPQVALPPWDMNQEWTS